jgi:hypothetical protein
MIRIPMMVKISMVKYLNGMLLNMLSGGNVSRAMPDVPPVKREKAAISA